MTKIKQYNCPECGGDELHIPIHLTIKGGKLLPIDFDYYYNNLPTDNTWWCEECCEECFPNVTEREKEL